jgi:hypothetical protein
VIALKSQVIFNENSSLLDVVFTGAYLKQKTHQLLELHENENALIAASPILNFPKEILDPLDEKGNLHGSDHVVNFSDSK